MADIAECIATVIQPALLLLPEQMSGPAAEVCLLSIGLQESGFNSRQQMGGPARSFWQFEPNGIDAVLRCPATEFYAGSVCAKLGVPNAADDIYAAFLINDTLACCFARLLLWSDPCSLPAINDAQGAWNLYQRCWRPGKPRYATWAAFHKQAVALVTSAA